MLTSQACNEGFEAMWQKRQWFFKALDISRESAETIYRQAFLDGATFELGSIVEMRKQVAQAAGATS